LKRLKRIFFWLNTGRERYDGGIGDPSNKIKKVFFSKFSRETGKRMFFFPFLSLYCTLDFSLGILLSLCPSFPVLFLDIPLSL